jgi:hypothetical protein
MKLTSRAQAKEQNLTRYFTGKPCRHGHVAERLVVNGTCYECTKQRVQKWQKENPEKVKVNHAKWVERNPGVANERRKLWYQQNLERHNAQMKAYFEANPHLRAKLSSTQRAKILQRTPGWLTEDDRWLINEIYELAALRTKATNTPWHVDHIIPLRGKKVSGLHVPANLQVIPAAENLKKGARYG